MGRPQKLTPAQVATAKARRSAGLTYLEVAAELGVSEPTVRRACSGATSRPARGTSAQGAQGSPGVSAATPWPADAPLAAMGLDEQRASLSDLLRVHRDSALALASTDPAASAASTRIVTALAGAIRHLTEPAPPRNPNELPDMVAAADRGRAKLQDYLERIRLGK